MNKLILISSFVIGCICTVYSQQDAQKHIVVDQFGYRPGDRKVAVVRTPELGFDSDTNYVPGPVFQIRHLQTDSIVFVGTPRIWNSGEIHEKSGDKGWWFDFSAVQDPGEYYVLDLENAYSSYPFKIAEDVYHAVLKSAMRMFYYQRLGIDKAVPYADAPWAVSSVFYPQDAVARSFEDPNNEAEIRDMSGGWMDAGDTNKYVTFASSPVHQLLTTYSQNTALWQQLILDIPESDNAIPDILDEVIWELKWLEKMQDTDGGVFLKIGHINDSSGDPLNSTEPRYYAGKCSSSTLAVAGMFAHAYLVFKEVPALQSYAQELLTKAELAWSNFEAINGEYFDLNCDIGRQQGICCGDADRVLEEQQSEASISAAYLFGATGKQNYNEAFLEYYPKNVTVTNPNIWGKNNNQYAEGLDYYLTLESADADAKAALLAVKRQSSNNQQDFVYVNEGPYADLYRAFSNAMNWGSNATRANMGNSSMEFYASGINPGNNAGYLRRAKSLIHYLHGVNPLGLCFLTNMGQVSEGANNAEFSASELYHTWFKDGSVYDSNYNGVGPAPGYLVGGPNETFGASGSGLLKVKLGTVTYPAEVANQPAYKAYSEENFAFDPTIGTSGAWELNEPAIYYQSAYVKLLANFVGKNSLTDNGDDLGLENSLGAVLPETLTIGETYTIAVSYEIIPDGNLFLGLFDTTGDWQLIGTSDYQVLEAGSSNTTIMSFTVPEEFELSNTYTLLLSMSDARGQNLAELKQQVTLQAPITENALSAEIPTKIISGQTYSVPVTYSALNDGIILLNLFDTSTGEWVTTGAEQTVAVSAGTSGILPIDLKVASSLVPGTDYVVYLNLFNTDYSANLATFPNTQVVVIAPEPVNSVAATIPTALEQGEIYDIAVTYEALEEGNLFLNLFDTSSGEWVATGSGASRTVSAGTSGTFVLPLSVPLEASPGSDYIVYLNLFNADYSGNLATFPNTNVTVVERVPQNKISAIIPTVLEIGNTYPIQVQYNTLEEAALFINLFDTSSGEWVATGDGSSVMLSGGTNGSVTLNLNVPQNAIPGTDYLVFLNLFTADYSSNLAIFPNTSVTLIEPTRTNSIQTTIPSELEAGVTYPLTISYEAVEEGNLFLNLFDTSSGEWVATGPGTAFLVAGGSSGTVTMNINVPANAVLGNNYVVFLNLFNSDYSADLATFPNTSVMVIAPTPRVVENLKLTSMCSNDPSTSRAWRVRNPNSFEVPVDWKLYGTPQAGSLMAPPGDSFFETTTVAGNNTVKLFWKNENGVTKNTTKASGGAACSNTNKTVTKPNMSVVRNTFEDTNQNSFIFPEKEDKRLFVYPNPVRNNLLTTSVNERVTYSINDMTGKFIKGGVLEMEESIDVSELAPNMYILRIGLKQTRFIVIR